MQFPFLPIRGTVVFHIHYRKTTVHKNGHNFRYAHCFYKGNCLEKSYSSVFNFRCFPQRR